MNRSIPFTPLIRTLPATVPFVGPEALERRLGCTFEVRVGANESAFGISPRAREAMREAVDRVSWYNDPENHDLREALAAHHGVSPANVVVGAGIDDLLGLTVRLFLDRGETAVTSHGAYPTFNYHVEGFGSKLRFVPYKKDRNDLEGLAEAAAGADVRLVYLANPDNPTGTWHAAADVRAFLDRLPEGRILILDEAYLEFAPPEARFPVDPEDPRMIRMYTFSKAHGMAGARVGYALACAEIVAAFEKVRLHFGVNRIAQIGALASLRDPAFVESVVAAVAEGRRDYETLARQVGLSTLPSAANFVAFDAGAPERAQEILDALLRRGVFVRKPGAPGLGRLFRVTVGTGPERKAFGEALRSVLVGEQGMAAK